MLTLKDGPCEGDYACRANMPPPLFLRAVISNRGVKDVLNLPEDTPKEKETVYVYKLKGTGFVAHLHMNPRSKSGFYQFGDYEFLPTVDGQQLRDNATWLKWIIEMAKLPK